MSRILVVAPHPDDETIGCGGTLLRHKARGHEIAWVLVTGICEAHGWPPGTVQRRDAEIEKVRQLYGFDVTYRLGFPTTRLDTLPIGDIVAAMSTAFAEFKPEEVLVPHRSDAHTDHKIVFDAAAACTKWFRYPTVRRVLAYETLSETDMALGLSGCFKANSFANITDFLERKLEIMQVYESEVGMFPFPRSLEALRALAALRGAGAGYAAAEAFELLRERE